MAPSWQTKTSFEALIDDLAERQDPIDVSPTHRSVSIDSLEAAWDMAFGQRKMPPPPDNAGEIVKYLRHAVDVGGTAASDEMLDPAKILSELGLRLGAGETEIAGLKREFALRNHPDRVPDELRDLATQRMIIANRLIDDYVARLRKTGQSAIR